jgi:hypothetical protein
MAITLQKKAEGYVLPVLVSPGSSRDEVRGEHDGRMKIALTAPPEGGKANKQLREFLAGQLNLRRSDLQILSGHSSRQKEVLVERASPDALDAILP